MTPRDHVLLRWENIAENTSLLELIRIINRRKVKLTIGPGASNTTFGTIPDLAWDYDAQAMLDDGHINGESLTRIDDQTGYQRHSYPVGSTFPVLEANAFGNYAAFNFEGNKGAVTSTEFITPTASPGCTVFAVVKRTGTHAEHTNWWFFSDLASPSGGRFGLKESHNAGPALDQVDKLQGFGPSGYIDALDTVPVVVAARITSSTLAEWFINGARADLLTQAFAFSGTSVNPDPANDTPCTFHMGNGIIGGGNGQEGKSPRMMGFRRALTDAEILTASDELMALYGAQVSVSLANGQQIRLRSLTELTTIAAAVTTDTTLLMPAGALVMAVNVRVTVAIPTAVTFTVGDSGSAARFNTGTNVAVAANTTDKGTKAGAYYNATALAVRITPSATPATNAGRVRVTVFYWESVPPTS